MIIKLCARCKKPIPYGTGHCPACAVVVEQEQARYRVASRRVSSKRYNQQLDKKIKAFYKSKEWELFRCWLMAERGYLCESDACTAVAVEVHHIKHLDTPEGWENRLEPNNCRVLCVKCHNNAHNRFGVSRGGNT